MFRRGAGRPMLFRWGLVRSSYHTKLQSQDYLPIESYLATQTMAILSVPDEVLPSGRAYVIEVTVQNWIGSSDVLRYVVAKSAVALHTVQIAGSAERTIAPQEDFLAVLAVDRPPCFANAEFVYAWRVSSGPSVTIPATSLSTQMFFIPRNTLQPGATYVFSVDVTDANDPGRTSSADLKLTVLSSPLIAFIVGGDRGYSKAWSGLLVLDGSASHDPDAAQDGVADLALEVHWKCKLLLSGNPCFNTAVLDGQGTVLNIGNEHLWVLEDSADAFVFTLHLRKESRTASASVQIRVPCPHALRPLPALTHLFSLSHTRARGGAGF